MDRNRQKVRRTQTNKQQQQKKKTQHTPFASNPLTSQQQERAKGVAAMDEVAEALQDGCQQSGAVMDEIMSSGRTNGSVVRDLILATSSSFAGLSSSITEEGGGGRQRGAGECV